MLIFEGLRQVDAYATPYAAFASRASVVVNHTDKVWPPAYELCARLGRRFGHAYANLYLTPGDSQTAPPHSDDRDVFVLQLHGARQIEASGIEIGYGTRRAGGRWNGRARLDPGLLPAALARANAYAIHGAGAGRRHLATHPVPGPAPDFHRLTCFAPIPWEDAERAKRP